EVGLVILLPLVISIRKSTKQNILLIGIPVLAGLSIVHGLVPPHPGAMTAIGIYNANMSVVLLYSLIIAFPTAVVAGPLFSKWINKHVVPEKEPELFQEDSRLEQLPGTGISFFVILLPILLMLMTIIVPYISIPTGVEHILAFIGNPVIALLIACFAAYYFLGYRQGMDRNLLKK